ncbi:MAG: YtxH domain-containing protein [Gemmatimonadetes bacterium]|nr:YtxH domain-containing protein [Gemmatimonadota bacterium]
MRKGDQTQDREHEEEGFRFVNFVTGLVLGAVIGAGAALLFAPQSGRRTRRIIRRRAEELAESAGDRWQELAGGARGKVDEALEGARKRFAG